MDILASLTPIFKPKSVAVIGASTAPGKLGHDILANLKNGGFPGALYPINPKADEILGLKVYKGISDTPAAPDLAVVVIPARIVAATLEQCAEKGVKAAIVITGGFAEAGPDGERLQDELAQVVRRTGLRVVGPNCQGVNMPHELMCASWPLITTRGRIAFASQSGTVGAAFLDLAAAEHLGVSGFVSLGNRVDVDEAEVLMYFNQDPHTKVIALYLEGVKRASYFLDALQGGEKTGGHPQGRPHPPGEPRRRVPHQVHGRDRRHLRGPVPQVPGPPGRHPGGTLRLCQGPGLSPQA